MVKRATIWSYFDKGNIQITRNGPVKYEINGSIILLKDRTGVQSRTCSTEMYGGTPRFDSKESVGRNSIQQNIVNIMAGNVTHHTFPVFSSLELQSHLLKMWALQCKTKHRGRVGKSVCPDSPLPSNNPTCCVVKK